MCALVLAVSAGADGPRPRAKLIVSGTETIVASVVATEAPFSADPTGARDATAAIQAALDAVGAANGGVVYLPPGRYRIDGSLKLPYSTTLAGAFEPLSRGDLANASVLLATSPGGSEEGPSVVDGMAAESALLNVAISYPLQNPRAVRPYPFTIIGQMMQIRNVVLCNSYNGIELKSSGGCVIENARGTCLRRGLALPHAVEFSWVHDVQFSAEVWRSAARQLSANPGTQADWDAVVRYCRENLVAFELGRLDGIALHNCEAPGAAIGFLVQKRATENPHPVFGLGGIVAHLVGDRDETGWDPWYYGMHYADLDKVPEAGGMRYTFGAIPMARRTSPAAFRDVTQAPYAAVGDGKADDTAALEKALADAGQAGGGVVYLPQGDFRVTRPLVVPAGVELRGPLGVGKAREYRATCSIAYCGANSPEPDKAPAVVTLRDHAGIRGLSIVYPEQPYDAAALKPCPYVIRGDGAGVWIADVMIVNAMYGIDLATHRCDGHFVRGVWATAMRQGLKIGGGSIGGKLERVTFSIGPWIEAGRFLGRTEAATKALTEDRAANATDYILGDCEGETTWGVASFMPQLHARFVDEGGGGCRDARMWLTMHDVGRGGDLQFDGGKDICLLGYFGTGDFGGQGNWLETGPAFRGPVHIYAPTIQQPGVNHPFRCTPEQVQFHNEVCLTTGRPATATATAPGSNPASATDRSPWTLWEAPAGSVLQVDLGRNCTINRFGVTGSGYTMAKELNIRQAELWLSRDGKEFRLAAQLNTWGLAWGDMPVEHAEGRYAQLRVTKGGADGTIRVAGFEVYGR